MSVGLDGATVTEVAHRHDVTRQQIYAWRHELKKKGLLPPTADTVFLPLDTSAMDDAPLGREEVAREPALTAELRPFIAREKICDAVLVGCKPCVRPLRGGTYSRRP
ncbi:transposase-like protein [Sinorhizobium fredii]|uniref:transposase n=1 Tax=Rhizobium fredii TaxID=380 RepID=UPI0005A4C530|nr:transposase [Sinorhizobium fredii]KSV90409.1 hypothetical protein N181_31565 [Sinorhizobium fredii USDA 205]MCK3781262.1 transposase [Ensifer sesbaniae]CEO91483.1 transposon-related [Sinorhizobium fredii HH103]AWI61817.1 hypothetical protein AB395_00004292 [Sinorhizobium fredii CCBAU 45436]AWM29758.1 transposon-related [Sinorhizobium fredii CCBAU 25509]